MGKITGFLEFERLSEAQQAPKERVKHWKEFVITLSDEDAKVQGARCMDCGIPFCTSGCPVNNIIPDFNDLVYQQDWARALEVLHSTNNFPEFTGRICPAPCEAACTLNINDDAVGIKSIEHAIIDKGWQEGWWVVTPLMFRIWLKETEHTIMIMIMPVVQAVDRSACTSVGQRSEANSEQVIMATTQPMAAASVGVATPEIISTKMVAIIARNGTARSKSLMRSCALKLDDSITAGASFGLNLTRITI